MGYRSEWLNHQGLLSVHSEAALHAIDRVWKGQPIRLLLVGVGNGGQVEVWRRLLSAPSTVTAVDFDPRWKTHDLGVLTGDVCDVQWVRDTLRGAWFDVIIDSTGVHSPNLWPYLVPGGYFVYEGYSLDFATNLLTSVYSDTDAQLPGEEVMSVTVLSPVLMVEKRNPRVVPYLDVIVGAECPMVAESFYADLGAKRVTPYKETEV